MRCVLTEPGKKKKKLYTQLDRPATNQSNAVTYVKLRIIVNRTQLHAWWKK